jgi:uncharacterized Zn-binding protein involved in type VI secretion
MPVALPVVRLGIDMCSGHPAGPTYFTPRPTLTGSPDVFVEGIPVVRASIDVWAPHTNIITVHPGMGAGGSPTVFCNGMPVMRIGDPIDCGSVAAMGSSTVFCG